MSRRMWLLLIAYTAIGVLVAASHDHFAHLDALKPIVAAVQAVLLWPLVLIGVTLHFK